MKKGFSLLELLIVVVIIGVVYTLVVSNFSHFQGMPEKPTLAKLKNFLRAIPYEKKVELICLRECSRCFVFVDGAKQEEFDKKLEGFLPQAVESYRYSSKTGFEPMEERVFFSDEHNYEKICFSYALGADKQGEEMFVVSESKVYDLTSAFQTPHYDSLNEALEARKRFETEVMR